jgi:hypothetical protein
VDLRDALEDARRALADAERDRERAARQLQAVALRIQELLEETRGLERALARHEGAAVPIPTDMNWQGLTRTDAIMQILQAEAVALSPTEITNKLVERGRRDRPPVVSAALAHLKSRGRVESAGYGKWRLVGADKDTSDGREEEGNPSEALAGQEPAP